MSAAPSWGRSPTSARSRCCDHELGVDRPLLVQYGDWIVGFVQGDMGDVLRLPLAGRARSSRDALANSLKLALVAFVLVVPLAILGGVIAALHANRPLDRIISIFGLSATVLPEFVSGIVLILVFGVWLRWLPLSATWPEGAGPLTQIYHLILPSMPLFLVLFGYIARMARAGTIEALDADYTRTAVLKGLPWPHGDLRRHVLRNALLPTITVIATQTGYLIGGLVVIEILFRYQGIGALIFTAAREQGLPDAAGRRADHRHRLHAWRRWLADLLYAVLNPRIRLGATRLSVGAAGRADLAPRGSSAASWCRAPADAGDVADLPGRAGHRPVLDRLRAVRPPRRALRPAGRRSAELAGAALGRALVRHRPARPRRVLARHRRARATS